MGRTFQARFRINSDDFAAFSDAYARLNAWRRYSRIGATIIAFLLLLGSVWFAKTGDRALAAFYCTIGCLLLGLLFVFKPMLVRQQFRRQKIGNHDIIFTADEDGFSTDAEVTRGTNKWSYIHRVDDFEHHVFLWPNDRIGYIVPKRAFASPLEAQGFVELAMQKTVGQTL